jgi:hypothetical protein
MLKKYHSFIFTFLTIIILLSVGHAVSALEVNYPNLPLAPTGGPQSGSSSLLNYIDYIFIFFVSAAGIIGVVSLTIGGFQYLVSGVSPEQRGNALDRIKGSILGIVLLMISFIILFTINPELIKPRRVAISGLTSQGLYYQGDCVATDSSCEADGHFYASANADISDTSIFVEPGYKKLLYYCPSQTNQKMLVWLYSKPDWEVDRDTNGSPNVNTMSLGCGDTASLENVQSFAREYEDYGIYFYLQDNCQGISTGVFKSSGTIPPFDSQNLPDKVASMRIINGSDPGSEYGVLFSEGTFDANGFSNARCTPPVWKSASGSSCINFSDYPGYYDESEVPLQPHYAYILNRASTTNPGDKVYLYSTDYRYRIQAADIGEYFSYIGDLDKKIKTKGDLNGFRPNNTPPAWECSGINQDLGGVYECLTKIEHIGKFYTILYTDTVTVDPDGTSSWNYTERSCQVFTDTTNNLSSTGSNPSDIFDAGKRVYDLWVLPRAW